MYINSIILCPQKTMHDIGSLPLLSKKMTNNAWCPALIIIVLKYFHMLLSLTR